MPLRLGRWIVVLALALHMGSPRAKTADRPDVKLGDRWQFVVYYPAPSVGSTLQP